ncbi:helix-turn-helix domain-containing protein [Streptomyces sp. BE303]|uniref:helix-turn-helix domain-containing protein n=1 Tax=Streptomyces sp. BE303 TaxID=3002528 RepID=UPI002E774FC2|nr:helix-turn-helix transcriptional regulator [Streptomyces sp. BE303]MED7955142.1 helix-turn-helix transcriptional regulator [Streptomyces sp. BE303]
MPPSKVPPSVRQRRLGTELRRLREQAGLSVTRAGELHGTQQSRISNIESGGYPVSADRVRALARLYGCGDDALIEALTSMTGGRTRGWWEEYREILPAGALDLAELEHHAQSMRIASAIHIPGLLQTLEHARALFRDVVPPLSPPEVEHLVSHRIKRQAVLHGAQSTPLSALVHEAALRMGFGGPEVARGQLEHLLSASEYPRVDLRVIPFGTGSYPGSGAGIVYFVAHVERLDSVQVDGDRSEFIDTEPQLIKYRAVMDRLETSALAPEASRDLIRRIARSI